MTHAKTRTFVMRRWLIQFTMALFPVLAASTTMASSDGITGRTNLSGGAGCGTCHSPSQTLGVSISGPTTLSITQVGSYSINISGGTASTRIGINVAASAGTLSESAANLQIVGGELTHYRDFMSIDTNYANGAGAGSYSFSYQLPGTATAGQTYTLAGASRNSGEWNHATNFTITVVRANQAALTALIGGSGTPSASNVGLSGALSTSGGSGAGAVSFASLTTGVCTVSTTTVSYIAPGTCTVRATKAQDTQYNAAIDDVSLTVNQGTQTITFDPLTPKLTGDPPFTVSATGGASGNPVTFAASGVCTSSGTNGTTITLTGAAGTCTVTASQAGNTNYAAASSVMRSFSVVAPGEVFPPDCQAPAGWTLDPAYPSVPPWIVATDSASPGTCSFKSGALDPSASAVFSLYSFTGDFQAGTISFNLRVSSFAGTACFFFAIDQGYQTLPGANCTFPGAPSGLSGSLPFQTLSFPITAGNHKIWLLYYRSNTLINGSDAAWVDQLTMPLLTSITSSLTASGTALSAFSYQVTATNFPQKYAATGLPPGLSINASTGLISGTPTAAGTYPVMVTVSNPGGAAPSATDTKTVTITVNQIAQVISFPQINNRLTTANIFGANATGNAASGIPVIVTTSTPSVCTAGGTNGSVIQVLAPGTCTLTANQAGNNYYAAATPVADVV